MSNNPEQTHQSAERQIPQPQVEYQALAEQLEQAVEQNIVLTNAEDELDETDVQAAIDAIPGLQLLKQLGARHTKEAGRVREGGLYRPNPNILNTEKPFIEIMSAQANLEQGRSTYLKSGADSYLRTLQYSSQPLTAEDIWLTQISLSSYNPAALNAYGLPESTSRPQFEHFKNQVKACLADYLEFLKPQGSSDFLDKQTIPFEDLNAVHQPADVSPELHDLLTERARIQQAMYELLTEHHQATAAQSTTDRSLADQTKRTRTARQQLEGTQPERSQETLSDPEQQLIDQALAAGRGQTYVNTDMVGSVELTSSSGSSDKRLTDVGYQYFSDIPHAAAYTAVIRNEILDTHRQTTRELPQTLAESVILTPANEDITETTEHEVKVPGLRGFFGQTRTVSETTVTGQRPRAITNLATGETEPGIYLDYQFKPTREIGDSIDYKCSDGRSGNYLLCRVLIPESVANELQAAIINKPTIVRELVHQLLVQNGGLPEDFWEGTDQRRAYPVRPAYEKLPTSWTVALRTADQAWHELPTS